MRVAVLDLRIVGAGASGNKYRPTSQRFPPGRFHPLPECFCGPLQRRVFPTRNLAGGPGAASWSRWRGDFGCQFSGFPVRGWTVSGCPVPGFRLSSSRFNVGLHPGVNPRRDPMPDGGMFTREARTDVLLRHATARSEFSVKKRGRGLANVPPPLA